MRTLALLLLPLALMLGASPSKLFKAGKKAEAKGKMAEAYLLYSQAAAKDPNNALYWLQSQAVRTRAALQAKPLPLPESLEPLPESAQIGEPDVKDLAEARKPQPPASLAAAPVRRDLNLRGDFKALWEQVAKTYGLDCVFDGDYQPGRAIPFRMDQADYREAIHALEAATGSFAAPLGPKLFMVAKDTPQKRNEVEPYAAVVIPLPEPTVTQDFTGLVQAVQQTMALEKVGYDTQKNIVVIRDKISKITPARKLFEDLLYPRAQVAIELDFIEVNRNDTLGYGLQVPTDFPIIALGRVLHSVPNIPQGVTALATFGGGTTLFGVSIASATLFANMANSYAHTLLQSELRSLDGVPATLHIGDRYPILTGGFFGAPTTGGQVYTPPPSFNFEDLGLSVKITPKVHGTDEVSLDLDTEFKLLGGHTFNGIPDILNRKLATKIRLKQGEWAVIGGMMEASEARTISGLAGLSSIPMLGALVSHQEKTRDANEVLIVIKPRLLTAPPDQVVTEPIRVGSETRPIIPL